MRCAAIPLGGVAGLQSDQATFDPTRRRFCGVDTDGREALTVVVPPATC